MTFNLETNQTQKRIDTDFYVEGYATTFKPYVLYYDSNGEPIYEQIDKRAFDNAIMRNVIFQYDHEGRVAARIENETLGLEVDERGLFIYADLSKTDYSRQLYEDIRTGMIHQMSWRFMVDVDGEYYDRQTRTIHVTRVKEVFDVSAVSIPANNQTSISARGKELVEKDKLDREQRKRRLQLKLKIGGN